jgi:bifunctional non-homologous end joining protein LigD
LDKSVRRVDTGDKELMLAIDDVPGLMSLVQAGVLEIHPWGSTIDHLEKPDCGRIDGARSRLGADRGEIVVEDASGISSFNRLVFDLDPGESVPWSAVIEAV